MTTHSPCFGAIEGGGTKFVVAIGNDRGEILSQQRFPTTDPKSTLEAVQDYLRQGGREYGALAAIGVASFGPVELDQASPRYGFIAQTPKPGWSWTDVAGPLARSFHCPIGFDTDVNAAALAEHRWGAARDVRNLVYVTIGTGIGGGVIANGAPIHGLLHPEIGHLFPRRHPLDAHFGGVCPFHADCMEGMASGPAIRARTGSSLQELDERHSQWEIEADYLGQLCAALVVTVSPERIVMGGGVMAQTRLLPLLRSRMIHWLGGYIERRAILLEADRYVVAPLLGDNAGVLGALALAMEAGSRNPMLR